MRMDSSVGGWRETYRLSAASLTRVTRPAATSSRNCAYVAQLPAQARGHLSNGDARVALDDPQDLQYAVGYGTEACFVERLSPDVGRDIDHADGQRHMVHWLFSHPSSIGGCNSGAMINQQQLWDDEAASQYDTPPGEEMFLPDC